MLEDNKPINNVIQTNLENNRSVSVIPRIM